MIDVVTTTEGLFRLHPEWNRLAARFETPLLSHEFIRACAEAYAKPNRLAIFVLRDGSEIQAIAPLHAATYGGVKRFEFLGERKDEPNGFLYAGTPALDGLARSILATRVPLKLARLPSDSPELETFRRVAHRKGVSIEADDGATVTIPLAPTMAELEKRMSSGRRSDMRRYRRRAEKNGAVEVEIATPLQGEVDEFLWEVFRIEGSGWKHRAGSSILKVAEEEKFWRVYVPALAKEGHVRIFFLKVGGATAAVRLAIAHSRRIWDYKIGYDERLRSCAPGILLSHETLRYGCENGFVAHEFLGRSEDWQKQWVGTQQRYCTFHHYPVALRSIGLFGLQCAWNAASPERRQAILKRLGLERVKRVRPNSQRMGE